jgi:Protein of unknown function (DUF3619)
MDKEDIFAKKITKILGTNPDVSDDIANKLANARKKALNNVKGSATVVSNGKNTLIINIDSKQLFMLLIGLILLSFMVFTIKESDFERFDDEAIFLNYQASTDNVPIDFLKDE